MERILIFIKHHFGILWKIIELVNGYLFYLFYNSKLEIILPKVFKECALGPFSYRRLTTNDIIPLYNLIGSQVASDLNFFHPHEFDIDSLNKQMRKPAFLMMGAFEGEKILGYFFLRFFSNRKCFVGRLIDNNYRGKGIGLVMNSIMYETSWRMGFRCLSTISSNNDKVMRAHSKNSAMVVLKKLQNDYLLVEFVKK